MEIIKTQEEINKCLEYSEKKEELKTLLDELRFFLSSPTLKKHFMDDKEVRNVYMVTIKRGNNNLSFNYGDSIDNTQKGKRPNICSLLCCIGFDYYCPDNFKDFCSEYGYGEDIIKANKIFKLCTKQSINIKSMFTEEESQCMPR